MPASPVPYALQLPAERQRALEQAYAFPVRAYHDYSHVGEVLKHYREVAEGPGWHAPRAVWLAVLYHDAIYVPGNGDNEERSALLLREHATAWPGEVPGDVEQAARLIALTARHGQWSPEDFPDGPEGDDTRHFLDCDMAILGASPVAFDAYNRAIAAEYRGVVPAWVFKLKRRAFLKGLLGRERIFVSGFFHDRYDAQARINLRRAITHKQ